MSGAAPASLLIRTARGAGWVIGFRMLTRLLGMVSTLILVRLLDPGDFGLIALATSFTGTIDALSNLSVHEAIIRERAPDRAMYDTAFTMNLIRGVLTTLLIAGAAQPVAAFFREPRLVPVMLVLALANLVGALESIATANFMRDFAFDREFRLWSVPRVVQVAAAVGFAVLFHSYWALAFGIMTGRLTRTALSYVMAPFRPRLTLAAWRRITGFTGWSWAIMLVQAFGGRIDTAVVGRLFTPAQVGVYGVGGEIATLPTGELVAPLCRACFPAFSELRNTGQGVAATFLRLLGATTLIVLPAGVGVAAVADPLVRLAFGERWAAAIPMIQILGVAGTLGIVSNLSGTLLSAFGMLRAIFAITSGAMLLRLGLLAGFAPGGTLTTVALLVTVAAAAEQGAYVVLTAHRFGIAMRAMLGAVHRSVLGSAVMAGVMAWSGLGFVVVPDRFGLHLAEQIATGAALYAAALLAIWTLAGRPDGPERDLFGVVAPTAARIGGTLAGMAGRFSRVP